MMIKFFLLAFVSCVSVINLNAQSVQIDGRLQPLLNDFFETCKKYDIEYHDKLFKLQTIDIVNTLAVSEKGSTLGMLRRNEAEEVVSIDVSWMAMLDSQILRVVAFHEFAHYFLEYSTHVCDDCGHIMAVVNTSYFDIAMNWDTKLKQLFEESPAYKNKTPRVAFVKANKSML